MTKQKVIKVLSSNDLRKVYSIDNDFHRSMMIFLNNTGLRVSELTSLDVKDVCYSDMTIKESFEVIGKRKKLRTIPLNKEAKESLFILIKEVEKKKKDVLSQPLILSQKKVRMSRERVSKIITAYRKKLNIEIDMSTHTFRHQFATSLIRKGCNLKDVQTLLGHESIKITMDIYSHSTTESLKEAVNLLN